MIILPIAKLHTTKKIRIRRKKKLISTPWKMTEKKRKELFLSSSLYLNNFQPSVITAWMVNASNLIIACKFSVFLNYFSTELFLFKLTNFYFKYFLARTFTINYFLINTNQMWQRLVEQKLHHVPKDGWLRSRPL
jgi:hypothetical protein